MQHIVVWDPENVYWEGAVVDSIRANELRSRGVAMLPCVPEVFKYAGISGYAKRSWGAGWPLDTLSPSHVCPLTIFVPYEAPRALYWAARLVPSETAKRRMEKGQNPTAGILRMASHDQRGVVLRAMLADPEGKNAFDASKLKDPDEYDGWTVGGKAQIHSGGEGCFGLALYGFAPGLRVAWVAATLAP